MAEQVVADVLHRLELARTGLGRREAARMVAVEAVEVGDVLEIADPLVDAQKVVGRRRDEIDRGLVGAEEGVDLGQARELLARHWRPPDRRSYGMWIAAPSHDMTGISASQAGRRGGRC